MSPNRPKFNLSVRSIENLERVHPDLIACVVLAMYQYSPVDFMVIEGLRSLETQEMYYEEGVSWTMNSKHLLQKDGTAHAVDLAPLVDGAVPWNDWSKFEQVNEAMEKAAQQVGTLISWGGNWKYKDGPHFQLMRY